MPPVFGFPQSTRLVRLGRMVEEFQYTPDKRPYLVFGGVVTLSGARWGAALFSAFIRER